MALVVLREKELAVDRAVCRERSEGFLELRLLEQLLLDPKRNCPSEGMETMRRVGEVGFQETLELDKGLLEENDMIDRVEIDPRLSLDNRRWPEPESPRHASCG